MARAVGQLPVGVARVSAAVELRAAVSAAASSAATGIIAPCHALGCNEIGDTQLEVRYEDDKLKKLCTDEKEMKKRRSDIAQKLKLRIKALETAKSVGELATHDPLGNWHQLGADRGGQWAGKLSENYRLLIRPHNASEPWDSVTVTVLEIDDYH